MLPPPFAPKNTVRHYFDASSNRTLYRVLAPNGLTIAEGIDSDETARQLACMDQLVSGYRYLLAYMERDFWHGKYDLPWSTPEIEELADDVDGRWEAAYPGLPEEAVLLIELKDIMDYLHPCPPNIPAEP